MAEEKQTNERTENGQIADWDIKKVNRYINREER